MLQQRSKCSLKWLRNDLQTTTFMFYVWIVGEQETKKQLERGQTEANPFIVVIRGLKQLRKILYCKWFNFIEWIRNKAFRFLLGICVRLYLISAILGYVAQAAKTITQFDLADYSNRPEWSGSYNTTQPLLTVKTKNPTRKALGAFLEHSIIG